MHIKIHYLTRCLMIWMMLVILIISLFIRNNAGGFFRIGPHKDMIIMGIVIDNGSKYIIVSFYCVVNSCIRALFHNILSPWLINNVQDTSKAMNSEIKKYAYEVTVVYTLYNWFDWFLTLQVLLSQIDMFILELIADMSISVYSSFVYLREKEFIGI